MRYARALTRVTYPWTDSGGCVECSRCCVPLSGKAERIAAKGAGIIEESLVQISEIHTVLGEVMGASHRHHVNRNQLCHNF